MSVYKAMVNELLNDYDYDIIDTQVERREAVRRGGVRPGAGRKKMKPGLKKRAKSFTLSPETVQALSDLQGSLGLPSQSAVVEFLALKAQRELKGDNRTIVERQEELF